MILLCLFFFQNAVEEYVYEIRGRIHEELEQFISESDKDKFVIQLEDTENWLYEEGEDCKKQIYLDKLAELKVSNLVLYSAGINFSVLN